MGRNEKYDGIIKTNLYNLHNIESKGNTDFFSNVLALSVIKLQRQAG